MAALSAVISDARNELIDTGGSPRWTDNEFIQWANDFFRELAEFKPNAVSARVTLNLAAGAFQKLPQNYKKIIEIVANAAGVAVMETDYKSLSASLTYASTVNPNVVEWASLGGQDFVVWPSAPGGGTTVVAYVVACPTVATTGDTVPLADAFLVAMFHYFIYRARSKDAEDTIAQARAADAYQKYRQVLGGNGEPAAA